MIPIRHGRLSPLILACIGAVALADPAAAGELRLQAALVGRLGAVEGRQAWLEGGFSRLAESGTADGARDSFSRAQAHVGLDWRPSEVIRVHVHGLARAQPAAVRSADVGLVEAFAAWSPQPSPALTLRFKAGLFLPQTSRENVEPLWQSRYTLTLSALNSWIGEEVRLGGLETGLSFRSQRGDEFDLAAGVFGGNDAAGTLLAWRGWGLGDHLVGAGETLPLPPLRTLRDGAGFAGQRDSGTQPVEELDDRPGFYGRARWDRPGALLLQASYFDSRGDRELHRGQYAWRTYWWQAGAELRLGARVLLIAEAVQGETGMGARTAAHVDVDFRTAYALATWGNERFRLSARYDHFETTDRDGVEEPGDESGRAWTVAALWTPWSHARIGLEWLDVKGDRPAASDSGFSPEAGGRKATLELRLVF